MSKTERELAADAAAAELGRLIERDFPSIGHAASCVIAGVSQWPRKSPADQAIERPRLTRDIDQLLRKIRRAGGHVVPKHFVSQCGARSGGAGGAMSAYDKISEGLKQALSHARGDCPHEWQVIKSNPVRLTMRCPHCMVTETIWYPSVWPWNSQTL